MQYNYSILTIVQLVKLDWSDPAAVRALTISLLARDFRLQVELPPDCLVPTLPSRQVF